MVLSFPFLFPSLSFFLLFPFLSTVLYCCVTSVHTTYLFSPFRLSNKSSVIFPFPHYWKLQWDVIALQIFSINHWKENFTFLRTFIGSLQVKFLNFEQNQNNVFCFAMNFPTSLAFHKVHLIKDQITSGRKMNK